MISPPQTAAGLLALGIAAGVTIFGSSHKPPPEPLKAPFPSAFEDLPKGNKLASAEPTPKIIKVIPVAKPAAEPTPKDEVPKDVCEKLGGWKKKVYHRHRESWRCAFPRRQR